MQSQEEVLRQQYCTILSAYTAAFPGVRPPDSSWFLIWFRKHDFADILDAIQTLSTHRNKHTFTIASIGKAISAMLRDSALRRVLAPAMAAKP